MKLEVFAVFDRQLNAYMQPWCAQSTGQAIRMFTDEVNNKEGAMNKHPDDYTLYHVGTYHQEKGKIVQEQDQPKQIAIAANVKEQ